jgi:adenylate kinase
MNKPIPVLILIGPPGGGKGTQGDLIAEKLSIPKISTGNLLRDAMQSETDLGRQLKAVMGKGGLVDDQIVLELLKEKLSQKECDHGFILDGFPRNLAQADELRDILAQLNKPFKIVAIDVAVPDQSVVDRIVNRYYCSNCKTNYNKLYKNPIKADTCDVCGAQGKFATREDDSEPTVKSRLVEYHKQTAPVLSYYDKQGALFQVDGDKPIDDVTKDIDFKLKKLLTY